MENNLHELKALYNQYKKENSLLKNMSTLKSKLLSADDENTLEFHYQIAQDDSLKEGLRNMIKSFFYSEIENKRDKKKVAAFFIEKYSAILNDDEKSDILRILGHLRIPESRNLSLNALNSSNYNLRYSSVIVLGWVGLPEDIAVLSKNMVSDESGQLRGYSATAMRQIWFNYPKTKDEIVKYIYEAIDNEKNVEAITCMVITVQELLKKKFGIKESTYGDVSGDANKAKEKFIAYCKKR